MKRILFIIILLATLISCEKTNDSRENFDFQREDLLRQIGNTEEDMRIITYNEQGNVFEDLGRFSYRKFYYNSNNLLIRTEMAQTINPLSCAIIPGAEFVDGDDPRKASPNFKSVYEYSNNGVLNKISNYLRLDKEFTLSGYNTFEYENGLVKEYNIYDINDNKIQFYTYQYDNAGNVSELKWYTLYEGEETLQSKTIYEYDAMKNPFRVFYIEGTPGESTNVNNIVKRKIYYYYNGGGVDSSTVDNTYVYNDLGYPVEVNGISYTYGDN